MSPNPKPQIVTLDFETYFAPDYSLTKITTEEYIRDPRFQTIGVGIKVAHYPTDWIPGPDVAHTLSKLDWSNKLVVCQNTMFDAAILRWHYGINPLAWLDTLGMSRALYPHEKSHSLKAQAERHNIGIKGDDTRWAIGKRLEDFSSEQLAQYGDYCINDVELTYKLFMLYMGMGFPRKELELIDLTLRMFVDPVLVLDKPMLETHLATVKNNKQELMEKVRDFMLKDASIEEIQAAYADMDGLKKVLMSNDKFAQALRDLGVEPPVKVSATTGKQAYAFAKTDEAFKALEEHEDPQVQALVAARLGNKSTLEETRTETLMGYADRGRFPIALRYYGAHTGRWSAESSAKVNMQNLPRKSAIKDAIKAPDGFVICGADLSNIELRLGLWLAGQDDRVEMLAQGLDLYKDFSSDIFGVPYEAVTKDQRQVGKVSNLSLIYGTGAARLREALRVMGGVNMAVDAVKPIVSLYRERYAHVAAAWRTGEDILNALVLEQTMQVFRGTCQVEPGRGVRLPNGLHIQYPNLRREYNADGKAEWVFDSKYGPERAYGAKVFQACTQAIARCIMADGLRRLQKITPVRLTIHDSAYWLAKTHEAEESLAKGIECITAPVSYCPGLPLAAEGAWGVSLADC